MLLAETSFPQTGEAENFRNIGEELCLGGKLAFEDYSIVFCEVISDSRCSKGVNCIWAGEAKVKLEFFKGNRSLGTGIFTSAGTSLAEFFDKNNIEISRFSLYPYPDIRRKINPEDYSLFIEISEKVD
ncbi:hypothetical protein C7S20_06375 [Christiangramia fulva]|uniref:Uncharacterized protein n=2 Tax=Christiangramia fulva TaxID=2126553 RepID=A0A2R3Z3U1_9FLAO|nr:hypothetical protein C7S20_06375 [Christiangramia fulva]